MKNAVFAEINKEQTDTQEDYCNPPTTLGLIINVCSVCIEKVSSNEISTRQLFYDKRRKTVFKLVFTDKVVEHLFLINLAENQKLG